MAKKDAKSSGRYKSSEVYFDGFTRYRPGTVFTLPAGVKPGRSMTEVKGEKQADAEEAPPETLSDLGKVEHKAQGDALV